MMSTSGVRPTVTQKGNIILEPASMRFIEQIVKLENEVFPADEAFSMDFFSERITDCPDCFMLAFLDTPDGSSSERDPEDLVGYVCGSRAESDNYSMDSHQPDGKSLMIHSFVVGQKYQGRGFARTILDQYLDLTVLRGRKSLDVQGSQDNEELAGALDEDLLFDRKGGEAIKEEGETEQVPIERAYLICKSTLTGFYQKFGFHLRGKSSTVLGKDDWMEMVLEA